MMICAKCKKRMSVKNEVGVDFGHGTVYAGDKYVCPGCWSEVISTNAVPHSDPNYKYHSEYVAMERPALK